MNAGIERCLGGGLSRVRPKGARTVLRGLGAGNRVRLPDIKSGSDNVTKRRKARGINRERRTLLAAISRMSAR